MIYPNDDELIYLYYRHNQKAEIILLERYSGIIKSWAHEFANKNKHLCFEELFLTGLETYNNLLCKYNMSKGIFYKYVERAVKNKFNKISIENYDNKCNCIFENSTENPDTFFYLREKESEFDARQKSLKRTLYEYDNFQFLPESSIQLLNLKAEGKSNSEIAKIMNITIKKVDNIYQSAKRKIKDYQIRNTY